MNGSVRLSSIDISDGRKTANKNVRIERVSWETENDANEEAPNTSSYYQLVI